MKLMFFNTYWSDICKKELELVEEVLGGDFKIEVVDVEKDPLKAREFSVRTIPAIVITNQIGSVVERIEGCRERFQYENLLNDIFGE